MIAAAESIGTEHLRRLTLADGARWVFAAVAVIAAGAGGIATSASWMPPSSVTLGTPDPVILLDLAPPPAPEPAPEPPVIEPDPLPTPEPVALPQPQIPEPVIPEPVAPPEPAPPPVQPAEPEVQPPPPEVLPQIEPAPPLEPEPPPEPEPEPVPEPTKDTLAEVTIPLPVTMSAELRQQRTEAPTATTRPTRPQPTVKKPAQHKPVAPAAQPAPAAATAGPSPAVWQAQVLRQLDRRKIYPPAAKHAGQEGVVQISFSIDANGRVLGVRIARSSGVPVLDQAALETARRASPVPKPPASLGLGNQTLTASVRFNLQ